MFAVQDYVSLRPGTNCVYAWKSSGGRRMIYCRIEGFEGTTVTIRLPMRNQPGHILLVVPFDRTRFQTLPNRLVNRAKDSYQLKSIKDLPAVVKKALKSGDVPIPTAISATSSIGVYGGAEIMKRYQIITLGYKGSAPLGVLGLAALPSLALSGYAVQKVSELENDPVTVMISKLGLALGRLHPLTPGLRLSPYSWTPTQPLLRRPIAKLTHRKRCGPRRSMHGNFEGRLCKWP